MSETQALIRPDPSVITPTPHVAHQRKLPDVRNAITHKGTVGDHKIYITAGMYDDGTLGEVFIIISKQGSTVSGLLDGFAILFSIALQYGVPLEVIVEKLCHTRFEPSGFTKNPRIPVAKSIYDYIVRWLASKFCTPDAQRTFGVIDTAALETSATVSHAHTSPTTARHGSEDGVSCRECGGITVRNGSCHVCPNCGSTSGCS